MKDFIKSINITTLEEAEELLKGGSDYDIFEKARAVGEFHANGKWVWTEYQPGKFDWRTAKKGGGSKPKKNFGNIVLNEGNGKVLNELWNEYNSISSEKQLYDWKVKVHNTKLGTYGTISPLEVIDNFKPKFPNKVLGDNFIKDVTEASTNEPRKLVKVDSIKPKNTIPFRNQKTVEEAEAWAKENLKHVGSVDYSGISIGDANKVNKVLLDLQRQGVIKGDGTFNLVPFKGGKQGGVGGSYQMMKHGFNGADLKIDVKFETATNSALRKAERYKEKIYEQRLKNTKDMISENIRLIKIFDNSTGGWENAGMYDRDRMLEQNKYLEKRLENFREIFEEENVGRYEVEFNTRARTMREALIHEYGHILNADMQMRDDKYLKEALDILLKIKKESGYRLDSPKLLFQPATNLFDERAKKYGMQVSHYASTCGAEYFAESFLMFNQGEKLPDEDLEKLFKILTK